jgi:hypothetical protein
VDDVHSSFGGCTYSLAQVKVITMTHTSFWYLVVGAVCLAKKGKGKEKSYVF